MAELKKILVVDDDRKIAQALGIRFRALGYDVRLEHDGEAGWAAVAQWRPHVLILDIRMPKLDGLALLVRLKDVAELRATPVIVLSASAVDEREALNGGAYCFVAKPYEPATLLAAVSAALHQSRSETLVRSAG